MIPGVVLVSKLCRAVLFLEMHVETFRDEIYDVCKLFSYATEYRKIIQISMYLKGQHYIDSKI